MQPEYETGHQMGPYPKLFNVLLLSGMPFMGVVILILALYSEYLIWRYEPPAGLREMMSGLSSLFLLLGCSAFCFYFGWCCIKRGLARFRFLKEGLMVKFPLEEEYLIPWDEFQQVCVIYGQYSTRGTPRASSIICCVKKGQKKNLYGRWKIDSVFTYRTVLGILFKPEYLAGIREVCPYQVPDLRDTGNYRL